MTKLKYKIKSGDTLSKIANTYNTTVKAIQNSNPDIIKDVNKIVAGTVIEIPIASQANYQEIGKQLVKCLNDIENLQSVKTLKQML